MIFPNLTSLMRPCSVMLLLLIMASTVFSAEVEYNHPSLSIIAEDEPLESVLIDLGKSMQISISTPLEFNPNVNCSIEAKSIHDAMRSLLRNISYSLEWRTGGEYLSALIIFGPAAGFDDTPHNTGGETRGTKGNSALDSTDRVERRYTSTSDTAGSENAGQSSAFEEREEQEENQKRRMEEEQEKMQLEREQQEEKMRVEATEYERKVREEMERESDNL